MAPRQGYPSAHCSIESGSPVPATASRGMLSFAEEIFSNPNFDSFYDVCKATGWTAFDVRSGHNVQVEIPGQLMDILLTIVA